ncbi:MAG: (4Fe-4S)-binding protein [Salinivirgaceae bacterium]|nr:(4Fe-4S)-binding protein [Salinivirgaceae bacterium]
MDKNDRSYTNGEITVHWKSKECVHAGTCFRELRKVFDPSRRPWIDLSQGDTEAIIDIVERCPTDALTFERGDKTGELGGTAAAAAPDKIKFNIMRNGPILAEGNFVLVKDDGTEQEIKSITSFCRCGVSRTMPFCDGTHNKQGFSPDEY